jgi:chromate transporter
MTERSTPAGSAERPRHPGFGEALLFWLKLGFLSFGGPAGQIALMHTELVERRRWIGEQRFLHALNYCMLLPGPEAQQLATYIGWLLHRSVGGVVAGLLFVLPSLFILVALSWVYVMWGNTPLVAGLFYGIKPAVTAIVLQAAWRIGSRSLRNAALRAIAVVAFLAIFVLHLPFPAIVLGAALIGLAGARFAPGMFTAGGHGASTARYGAAVIDDDTPLAEHTRFRRGRLAVVLALGAAAWALPMVLLTTGFGWQHIYPQMGWFFTKAALLTFGGAYAVLPYVYQGAVLQFGWLSATQMIDGLALGETTPGPLIMVVAFVGFVGAWGALPFGAEHAVASAALAALLVTWFTFLPSFVFILAGAPLVESTHGNLHFSAPLSAITAAVVGVVLNLALFFAWHVLWPEGFSGAFEWPAAVLAVLAAVALLYWKRGVIEVLAASACCGLLISLLRASV